jgi:hypothetical protein
VGDDLHFHAGVLVGGFGGVLMAALASIDLGIGMEDNRMFRCGGDRRTGKRGGSPVGVFDHWSGDNVLPAPLWPVGTGLSIPYDGAGPGDQAVGSVRKTGTIVVDDAESTDDWKLVGK